MSQEVGSLGPSCIYSVAQARLCFASPIPVNTMSVGGVIELETHSIARGLCQVESPQRTRIELHVLRQVVCLDGEGAMVGGIRDKPKVRDKCVQTGRCNGEGKLC